MILARPMAINDKMQDLRELENLIKEIDERHSKAIEDIRAQNIIATEEPKLLIAGIAQ